MRDLTRSVPERVVEIDPRPRVFVPNTMRRLVLIAVLAGGCDAGARATPPPAPTQQPVAAPVPPPVVSTVIGSDEEFVRQAMYLVDEMLQMFAEREPDCDRLATGIETWGAQNVTRIGRLSDYSKAHPTAQQALQKAFEPRMTELMNKLSPTFTKCTSNKRLMDAFAKLDTDARQLRQRPR